MSSILAITELGQPSRQELNVSWRKDSTYPAVVEDVLAHLALYNWEFSTPANPYLDNPCDGLSEVSFPSFGPAYKVTDSLIVPPLELPTFHPSAFIPEEPYAERTPITIDRRPDSLQIFLRHVLRLTQRIAPYRGAWPFLTTAARFLVRAFNSTGTVQLLWHITAIEAVLGQNTPDLTSLLATRIGRLFAGSDSERPQIEKAFRECYDLRSRFVHGDDRYKNNPSAEYRASVFARHTLLWALHCAADLARRLEMGRGDPPKKRHILDALDGRPVHPLCMEFPIGFPNVPAWCKDKYGNDNAPKIWD